MEENKEIFMASGEKFSWEDEKTVLELLSDIMDELGWENELVLMGDAETPMMSMKVGDLGESQAEALIEVLFMHPDEENDDFFVAQITATVFNQVPEENIPELTRAIPHVNLSTLAGGYGIFDQVLFYRNNLLLRPDYPMDVGIRLMTDAIVNSQESVSASVDGLAMIAKGMKTLEQTIEEGYLD